MAKCIRNKETGTAIRVPDNEAHRLVRDKGFQYISKTEFKAFKSASNSKSLAQ